MKIFGHSPDHDLEQQPLRVSAPAVTRSILTCILLFAVSMQSAHGADVDGFDYPFGPPDGEPRCPGSTQCSGGWQNVQDFTVNNHLGEDWNFGFGSDDLGKPVYAAGNGAVTYAQDVGGDGSWKGVIIIHHTGTNLHLTSGGNVDQVKSMYAHLDPVTINNWVTLGSVVSRGQQIGTIGHTPTNSTGPHLHFEIRTNLSTEVGPGYSGDPTGWIDPSDFIDLNRPTNSSFLLTAESAIQVHVPAQDGYRYQIFSSTDFTNWLPNSEMVTACGGSETFSFPTTNDIGFYKAQEWPPDLSKHIVGLTNVFLDNARVSSAGSQVTVAGMRVQSRDYTFDDYVTATYAMDFCEQSFVPQTLEIIMNVGPTCGTDPVFFLNDATNALVTGGGAVEDINYPLTTTGLTFTVEMSVGNMLELVTSSASADFRTVVTGPTGIELSDYVVAAGSGSFFHSPINAYRPGNYAILIEPFNATNISLNLRFRNLNRRPTTTVISGGTISAVLEEYWADYAKFKISAAAGQTLQLASTPGPSESVVVCNSLGIAVGGFTGGGAGIPLIVPIPKTDDYIILYFHREFSANSYSTTVTLSP